MRRKRVFQCGFVLLALTTIVPLPLLAQTTGRGEVRGVVRDQNQLVVPGADVVLVNQATNFRLSTISSEVGVYFLGAVPIGGYSLTVKMPGFTTWTTKFSLQAGSTVAIDVVLQVGDIAIAIEVFDTFSEVGIDRLEIADVKDFDRIRQLPLNGRDISSLFSLTPGVEGAEAPRVVGMKVGSVEMTLDGVSFVDRYGGGMRPGVEPGLDIVQEFRIETVGSDARFSRPSTVTLVSRSGTNELHGTVFWTHRNNGAGLRARRREELEDPSKLIRNEFGVTAGGPVWLGNLYDGRDKTFWFFSYEGLRTRSSQLNGYPVVPMLEWWKGDFSNLLTGNEEPITLYDPFTTRADGTRDPFSGNQIPQGRFHPMAATLESITAKPNRNVNPALGDNFRFFYPVVDDSNKYTVKADQVISEKDNLSVRWTRSANHNSIAGGVFANPPPDGPVGGGGGTMRRDATINNVAVNWNRAWSPSLLNELLVGVHRVWKTAGTLSDGEKWADKLGLPNPFDETGWPDIYAWDGTPGAEWGGDNRTDEPQTHVTFEDNVTWITGDHVLQFGGKARVEHNHVRELVVAQGFHAFHRNWTSLYDPKTGWPVHRTGTGLASAMLGLSWWHTARFNRGYFYYRQNEFGLYLNDKWKVNPKLTVNLGLRWDAWTPYREKQDRLVDVDINTFEDKFEVVTPHSTTMESLPGIPGGVLSSWAGRGLTWTTADSIGYPGALYKPDWNNLGPRVGISYMLTPKTVIRGSYGEYFWTTPLTFITQQVQRNPPLALRFDNFLDFKPGNLDSTGLKPIYTWTNAPEADDFVEKQVIDTEGTVFIPPVAQGVGVQDGRNWRDGHARTWHITLEQEAMRNTALRFSYTGTMGRDLIQNNRINEKETEFNYVTGTGEAYPNDAVARDQLRRNPNWTSGFLNRRGFSNTHTGQVELERRFSEGVGFQAFYVYTRSMTTSDAHGFSGGFAGINTTSRGTGVPSFTNLYQYPNPVGSYFTRPPSYEERLRLAYVNSANIPPHRIRFNGIVDLPFGRGKRFGSDVSGALNQIIRGWQVAFIGDWRSGFYRTISTNRGVFSDYIIDPGDRPKVEIFGDTRMLWFAGDVSPSSCTGGNCAAMAALVPEDRSKRAIRPYGQYFDNRVPLPLEDGGTYWAHLIADPWGESNPRQYWPFARNNFMGPRNWNVDLSIFKNFYFTEDIKLRLTVDFFNVFNHPNNPDPDESWGLVNLGIQTNEPRTVQLSLRFDW